MTMARIPTGADIMMAGFVGACTAAVQATLIMTEPLWGGAVSESNFLKQRYAREAENVVEASLFAGFLGFSGSIVATSIKRPLLGL